MWALLKGKCDFEYLMSSLEILFYNLVHFLSVPECARMLQWECVETFPSAVFLMNLNSDWYLSFTGWNLWGFSWLMNLAYNLVKNFEDFTLNDMLKAQSGLVMSWRVNEMATWWKLALNCRLQILCEIAVGSHNPQKNVFWLLEWLDRND